MNQNTSNIAFENSANSNNKTIHCKGYQRKAKRAEVSIRVLLNSAHILLWCISLKGFFLTFIPSEGLRRTAEKIRPRIIPSIASAIMLIATTKNTLMLSSVRNIVKMYCVQKYH